MEELSTSVPRDRSGSEAFSSCRISLVTLVLAAAAAALITLQFWYMLVRPRSWTCACLLRLSWSVPRVAYNEVVSCDAGHDLWKLLTGSVQFVFCVFHGLSVELLCADHMRRWEHGTNGMQFTISCACLSLWSCTHAGLLCSSAQCCLIPSWMLAGSHQQAALQEHGDRCRPPNDL